MTVLKFNRCLIGFLLFLSIVFPTVFFWQKVSLLAASIFCSIMILNHGVARINWKLSLIPIFYAIVGVAYSLYGLAVGAPGAIRVLTVMVVYPLLLSIVAFTYEEEDANKLFRILIFSAWALVVVDLIYLASDIIAPDNFFVSFIKNLYEEDAVIDDAEEYFKFTLPNVSSLLFLFPFLISVFFSSTNLMRRLNVFLLLLFSAILVIASGRRALFVVAFAGPLIAWLLFFGQSWRNSTKNEKKSRSPKVLYLSALVCLVGGFSYGFGLTDFYLGQVKSIFDFGLNDSNHERILQFDALFDGIVKSPFFGNGAGAAASYSRSDIQPWAYELSYMALMFQYGIFGFLLYLAGIIFLACGLYKSIKRRGNSGLEYFFFSGFLSFLIANATNPYLAKFDYMWVIFVPFAILVNGYRKVN